MNWLSCSLLTLVLWGAYTIFANKANIIHGENVTMVFETIAFIVLTIAVGASSRSDFARITPRSALYASIMGIMSAGGFYFLLLAFRKAPGELTIITLITAMYPVITFLIVGILLRVKPNLIAEAKRLTPTQLFGVVMAVAGLVLVNWDPAWSLKIKVLFGMATNAP